MQRKDTAPFSYVLHVLLYYVGGQQTFKVGGANWENLDPSGPELTRKTLIET